MSDIPESDWKRLRSLTDAALEELCERLLARARAIVDGAERGKARAACHELDTLVRTENGTLARCFGDFRRSTAIVTLLSWRRNGLLDDERLKEFTTDTQERIRSLENIG